MIHDDAKNLLKAGTTHSDVFRDVVPRYSSIVQKNDAYQVAHLAELKPLLPYVVLANAMRDVAVSLGKDIRNSSDYDFIATQKRELVCTRIDELHRLVTEGWIPDRKGMSVKVTLEGLSQEDIDNLDVFHSTYAKYLATPENAADVMKALHVRDDSDPDGQLYKVPTLIADLLKGARSTDVGRRLGE